MTRKEIVIGLLISSCTAGLVATPVSVYTVLHHPGWDRMNSKLIAAAAAMEELRLTIDEQTRRFEDATATDQAALEELSNTIDDATAWTRYPIE